MYNPYQQSNLLYVQGEAGAKAYHVAPNTTVVLWDSESPTIYVKSADMMGYPTMTILEYKKRETPTPNFTESSQTNSFVTKEQFHTLEEQVANLTALMREKGIGDE